VARREGAAGSATLPADMAGLYARLAQANGWPEPWAAASLRLVDALWSGAHEEFAEEARVIRAKLEAEGLSHDALRVIAGLAVMRAEVVIADAYHMPVSTLRRRMREQAEVAKRRHVFPWHLLDG
jgi:hypothetical protein